MSVSTGIQRFAGSDVYVKLRSVDQAGNAQI